jgi:hypothetical protein
MSSQHDTVQIPEGSDWRAYRDAVFPVVRPFKGTRRLEGTFVGALVDTGMLPTEFLDSARNAEYVIYSHRTAIAWLTGGRWYMPNIKHSHSTTEHQHLIRSALDDGPGISGTGKSTARTAR